MQSSLRHRLLTALLLTIAALASTQQELPAQIRIACLGDSITFGALIDDREHSSYPAWLNEHLGEGSLVRNFGVGGATMLLAADKPYLRTDACRDAIAWRPDIAIVMLGTNDTCNHEQRPNWQHAESLAGDAAQLVAALVAARNDIRIVMCSPPPMFPNLENLKPERRADLIVRCDRINACAIALQQVAQELAHVEYLELRSCLRPQDVKDGVHPTAFGAERIARRVAEAIRSPLDASLKQRQRLAAQLKQANIQTKPDEFHGFEGIAFQLPVTGASCRVFSPHGIARDTPWVWRARFFGHEPELDLALLERGFHLVYCDVSNLYGSQVALARYAELYALLQTAGFHSRTVLEGMSRGGLPILNWALAYPQHVAAIYGDNPVVDIRSWPGGNTGKRSDSDWQRCLAAYELDEVAAKNFEPVTATRLQPLANLRIPLLLVLGVDDDVVPTSENGELLATRYAAVGGPVEVWRKPGNGHHPHGLHPVDPLLRAILRATGFAQQVTTTPSPSVEYRSGAGWNGDSWRTQVDKMRALAKQHANLPIVFLGDSITQGLTGATDRVARPNGTRAIDKAFGHLGAISLGLSGDRTEHVLYRIQHGSLRELDPKVIVLQIGVNNVVTGNHSANEVLDGIQAVIESLQTNEPQAEILVCGPFPAKEPGSAMHQTINAIHAGLRYINDAPGMHGSKGIHHATYLDLRALFLNEDGSYNDNMGGDRVHITAAGQQAWLQALLPAVQQLMQPR